MDDKIPLSALMNSDDRRIRIRYDGAAADVVRISLTNALLTIITLGIYRFWAKTRLRRYLWGRCEMDGDPLEYDGTGRELLLGFMIALLVLIPIGVIDTAATLLLEPDSPLLAFEQIAYVLAIWFLLNLAFYRARKYRLTRTRWRGLRFSQTGSAWKYALRMMAWQLLMAITLFLALPFYRAAHQRYLFDNSRFGEHEFRFLGKGRSLFGSWVLAWLLMIPTLGLIYVWYRVKEFNYFANHTRFRGLIFKAGLRTGEVMGIVLFSQFIMIALIGALVFLMSQTTPDLLSVLTAGVDPQPAGPPPGAQSAIAIGLLIVFATLAGIARLVFYVHPMVGAVTRSVYLTGEIDFESLTPATDEKPRHGEGLFDALDSGGI